MAQSELTQSAYDNIKKALNGGLSDNKASAQFHVGKVRVALVRRSSTYQGYLRIRKNEAKKRLESVPAKAVPGTSELPQENQEFLAQTDDGKSLPADKTKTDAAGTHDARTDDEIAADEAAKADRAKEAEARRRNAEYARRERNATIFSFVVIALAFVGIIALGIWIFSLVF